MSTKTTDIEGTMSATVERAVNAGKTAAAPEVQKPSTVLRAQLERGAAVARSGNGASVSK